MRSLAAWVPAAGLILVTLLAWAWITPMAIDMYGAMTGPSAWMMTMDWDATQVVWLWAMWAAMMAAMMLPSATPMLLLHSRAPASQQPHTSPVMSVYVMAAGYLLVWAAFSVGATVLQRLLSHFLLLNAMMEMPNRMAAASVLIVAGAYQLTPLKTACLRACRSPIGFLLHSSHARGALRLGVDHGLHCLGCCWALMLLLFAGGVMNLYVIIGLTIIVLVEKVTPMGVWISRAIGVILLGVGLVAIVGQLLPV